MKVWLTILLLIVSNVFMTFAWYGNLKLQEMKISTDWPLFLIILCSWGVALFEYSFMIPANRIGSQIMGGPFSLVQLKVIQEVISITVFSVIVTVVVCSFCQLGFPFGANSTFGAVLSKIYGPYR